MGADQSGLQCRFMVANNFLQDVAACPLVFPSEGAAGGAAKPVLPPVEEILDVEDSDDEGVGEGVVEGMDQGVDEGLAEGTDKGMDPSPSQDAVGTAQVGDDATGVADEAADGADQRPNGSADVSMEAAPQ